MENEPQRPITWEEWIMSSLPKKFKTPFGLTIAIITFILFIIGVGNGCLVVKEWIFPSPPSDLEILGLESDCKWGNDRNHEGNYASCKRIVELADKYKNNDFIQEKYNSIVSSYSDLTPILKFLKPIMDSEDHVTYCMGEELATSDLQGSTNSYWYTNAWGAFLLRDRPEKGVPEELINIIKTKTSAAVKEIAIDSYSVISRYKNDDGTAYDKKGKIFDVKSVLEHFKNNGEKIIKRMEEKDSVRHKPCSHYTVEQLNEMGYKKIDIYSYH